MENGKHSKARPYGWLRNDTSVMVRKWESTIENSSCCPSLLDENLKDIPKEKEHKKSKKKFNWEMLVKSLFSPKLRIGNKILIRVIRG